MMEPTEGIPWSKIRPPFLSRNLSTRESEAGWDQAYNEVIGQVVSQEDFETRVIPENYRLHFKGWNYLYHKDHLMKPEKGTGARGVDEEGETAKEKRNSRFEELFVRNTAWMKDKSGEEVDRIKTEWQRWINEGPHTEVTEPAGDVEMGDA